MRFLFAMYIRGRRAFINREMPLIVVVVDKGTLLGWPVTVRTLVSEELLHPLENGVL